MKSRRIILRKACMSTDQFEIGVVYRCEKLDGSSLKSEDFWHNAYVWVRPDTEFIENVGYLQLGAVVAVVNGVLYPSVFFDGAFKFIPIEKPCAIEANTCRNRSIKYIKHFN